MKVGGQAIIEGVLMMGRNVAIAVRNEKDEIVVERIGKRTPSSSKWFRIPFIRGLVSLYYSLYYGIYALNRSAEISTGEKMKKSESFWTLVLALALAVGLFLILPVFLVGLFKPLKDNEFLFSLTEGFFRVGLFLIYVAVISTFKDVKRLFQYHGAEHKTIHAFEASEPLVAQNIKKHSTIHPRCGTNFVMIFLIVSVIVFSLLGIAGPLSAIERVTSRVVLIPIVMGLSYEFLRAASKGSRLLRVLSLPGLILQKMTTAEPDEKQIETAISALQAAIEEQDTSQQEIKKEGPEFFG